MNLKPPWTINLHDCLGWADWNRQIFNSPGHGGDNSQGRVRLLDPTQSLPPYTGYGSVQCLKLVWVPFVPQVTVQKSHSPHASHPPLTTIQTKVLYRLHSVLLRKSHILCYNITLCLYLISRYWLNTLQQIVHPTNHQLCHCHVMSCFNVVFCVSTKLWPLYPGEQGDLYNKLFKRRWFHNSKRCPTPTN